MAFKYSPIDKDNIGVSEEKFKVNGKTFP